MVVPTPTSEYLDITVSPFVEHGSPTQTDDQHGTNNTYDFNGTTQYLTTVSEKPIGGSSGAAHSISCWIKTSSSASGLVVAQRGGVSLDATSAWQLILLSGDIACYPISSTSNYSLSKLSTTVNDGNWHLITVTINNSDINIYVDGVEGTYAIQDSDVNAGFTGVPSTTTALHIGAYDDGIVPFAGFVSRVKVWEGTELSDAEALEEYNNEVDAMTCDITADLEALYHFTGDATDSSGNGNDGTVTGATLTTDKNAVSNQAYNFSTSRDYINTNTWNSKTGDYSVSMWINQTTLSATDSPTLFGNYNGTNGLTIRINHSGAGSKLVVVHNSASSHNSTFVPSNGTWYHIVCTYDSVTNTSKIYANSVLNSTNPSMADVVASANTMWIGADPNLTLRDFNGKIDEVRMFDRVLNQHEVDVLYSGYDNPTCPVGGYANKVNNILPSKVDDLSKENIAKVNDL